MSNNPETENNYELIKNLEIGSNTVIKLAKDLKTKKKFVIKIFNYSKRSKYPKNEYKTLKTLNHKNILKAYNFHKDKKNVYITLEYACHGDFFVLVQKSGGFSENLSKYYTRQLLSAITYLKKKSISHRDIKLENLLLSEKLVLKLADFEYSKKINEKIKNSTQIGTKSYMSPELHYKKKYHSEKIDSFSFGITLFIMVAGHPPFHKATHGDKYYFMFNRERKKFWEIHQDISGKPFSEEFIELVCCLFEYDPRKRFGFLDVLGSRFFKEGEDQRAAIEEIKRFL